MVAWLFFREMEPNMKNYFILIVTVLFYILYPIVSIAKTDVRDSMVKIYSVQNKPDYDNPWNMDGPESVNGSGCVISGNRILTNAHVIATKLSFRFDCTVNQKNIQPRF